MKEKHIFTYCFDGKEWFYSDNNKQLIGGFATKEEAEKAYRERYNRD